jgi:FtsP/CotA-like multicopper oxidase with cupredoxin domain
MTDDNANDNANNTVNNTENNNVTRRRFLGLGLGATAGVVGAGLMTQAARAQEPYSDPHAGHQVQHGSEMLVGKVDHVANGFDPMQMLVDWDYGTVTKLPDGRTQREYKFEAGEHEIEIAPGLKFPAWSYNGRVPGPTIRCTEGDRIKVNFINYGTHPHTIHVHGFHTAESDGVPGIGAGESMPGNSVT